jgi:ABC-type sugar transport system substrate-binding protein
MSRSLSRSVLAVAVVCSMAAAQGNAFAAPVQVFAGDAVLGKSRLYPSPMLHDLNGDGHLDVVVGDLRGRITTALRLPGAGEPWYAAEQKLMAADGKELDFANW